MKKVTSGRKEELELKKEMESIKVINVYISLFPNNLAFRIKLGTQ